MVQYVGAYTYTCVLLNGVDEPVPRGEGYGNLSDICISSAHRKILCSFTWVLLWYHGNGSATPPASDFDVHKAYYLCILVNTHIVTRIRPSGLRHSLPLVSGWSENRQFVHMAIQVSVGILDHPMHTAVLPSALLAVGS